MKQSNFLVLCLFMSHASFHVVVIITPTIQGGPTHISLNRTQLLIKHRQSLVVAAVAYGREFSSSKEKTLNHYESEI